MKTLTLHWPYATRKQPQTIGPSKLNGWSAMQFSLVTLLSLLCAALVSVSTIWAVSSGAIQFVSASYWAVSFIFLALGLEIGGSRALGLAGTGLAFMLLAWLSSRIAPEFGILAGFLLSAWVAVPVFRRLSGPDAYSVKKR